MTGLLFDGESVWDGPEWAAPERAERLASNPVRRANASDLAVKLLVHDYVTVGEFLKMRRMELQSARANRTRAVQRRTDAAATPDH